MSIYTYHDKYIALLSSLKKLNVLKALPPGYNLFSQGVFFLPSAAIAFQQGVCE
ncbi:hypothetical protein [Bacteroides acidifaciens]|uniref:hypothetical protein n=1 Tax=Bacteroides acidifaciens TaxID=85831 RepID=UPI002592CCFF|nr:hypothetical protein [Bacteroides acidifaciens]